jgi:hypothetical protein
MIGKIKLGVSKLSIKDHIISKLGYGGHIVSSSILNFVIVEKKQKTKKPIDKMQVNERSNNILFTKTGSELDLALGNILLR